MANTETDNAPAKDAEKKPINEVDLTKPISADAELNKLAQLSQPATAPAQASAAPQNVTPPAVAQPATVTQPSPTAVPVQAQEAPPAVSPVAATPVQTAPVAQVPTTTQTAVASPAPAQEIAPPAAQPVQPAVPAPQAAMPGAKSPTAKTSLLAIFALIFSILVPLIGLILGFVAISHINKNTELKGKGLAIAAVVLGGLVLLAQILFVVVTLTSPVPV